MIILNQLLEIQEIDLSCREITLLDFCTGKYVATGGFYFRHAHPDVQIDLSDLDNLTLQEYDRLCGVERRYFTVREMAHKRQAYDQRRKEFRKFCKQRDLEEKKNEK